MEKKLPDFKPLPELGNVSSNYMSAFNVGMNIYEALTYLQGYVQITYNSVNDLIDDWNNFENYITENIYQITNEKTQSILQGWLDDGTIHDILTQKATYDILGTIKLGKTYENGRLPLLLDENDRAYIDASNIMGADYNEGHYPLSFDENYKAKVDLNFSNTNLLDNTDFKSGIINQRDEDSYTGSTSKIVYTIDRWSIDTKTQNTLTVKDGYVSLILADNCSFTQYLDNDLSGKLTYAIKLKDGDLKVATSEDSLIYDFGEIETGVNVKAIKDVAKNKWRFRIQNTSGSNKTLEIEFIKLEKGSVFTGMPEWNETIEMLKCQAYYQRYIRTPIYAESDIDTTYFCPLSFATKMKKTPTITAIEVLNKSATDQGDVFNSSTSERTNIVNLTLTKNIGQYGYISLEIDCETY